MSLVQAAVLLAAAATVPAPASPADWCESLFVPEGYTLVCETRIEAGERTRRAVVRPSSGAASALAELKLEPLERGEAPLAWSQPERWLKEQIAVDVTGVSSTLQDWSGSGPFAHPVARATLEGLVTMLSGWSRLPLEGCGEPSASPGRHELRCSWGVDPLTLAMNLRLVEAGDQRYAVSYWAADADRLRHLEAIANSFKPG